MQLLGANTKGRVAGMNGAITRAIVCSSYFAFRGDTTHAVQSVVSYTRGVSQRGKRGAPGQLIEARGQPAAGANARRTGVQKQYSKEMAVLHICTTNIEFVDAISVVYGNAAVPRSESSVGSGLYRSRVVGDARPLKGVARRGEGVVRACCPELPSTEDTPRSAKRCDSHAAPAAVL